MKKVQGILFNIFPIFFKNKDTIGIKSMCIYRINSKENRFDEKYILVNDKKHNVKMKSLKLFKFKKYVYYVGIYKVTFDLNFLASCPIQNGLKLTLKKKENILEIPIVYNIIHLKKYNGYTSKVYSIDNSKLACYFRQKKNNYLNITVRKKNITDCYKERIKIFVAWLMSKLIIKDNRILLYEKECNKYEESAAVLYERLIDDGCKAYFIIRKDSNHNDFIKGKYKANIIYAYTFKHYLNFFRCKKFISTETLAHVIEPRIANKFVTKKIEGKKYKYIFLQHGITYMVALDSKTRAFFRKGHDMPNDSKVVVSSKLEAEHFVQLGGFKYDDLYITGLPFFDRTIKKDSADKIVIMPTGRPWDYNILISDYTESSYYNYMKRIFENIPEELKEHVILLPHPLIKEMVKDTDLAKFIPDILSYDKILEDTALLITDYSSISYSAFYRGSNVIFVWNELEECMKKYEGHLMLNADNSFGDIVYDYKDLKQVVKNNYLTEQKEEYILKYRNIVEFYDNKNTERLIECLKKDKFI